MGTYVPEEIQLPVGLDEAGLARAMDRLPEETLAHYRRRLLLEVRDPSDPTGESVVRHVNRKIGQFELPVFDIELVLDEDDLPVAVDPYVEITSTWLRAYHNYDGGELDFEVDLRSSRWLVDVVAAFSGSAYFSATTLDDYSDYLGAQHLRIGNTSKWVDGRQLFASYQNTLPHKYIKEMWFTASIPFADLKETRAEVEESGDYWIDYDNGLIISYDTQGGLCYYTYRQFPYRVYWQPVRVLFANEDDLEYEFKDNLVSDETGEEQPALLNSRGAVLYNRVLATHPLGWG
jgi:hypothetical protein